MKKIIFFLCLHISSALSAQPYLDIVKFNYSYSPQSGINEKKDPLKANLVNLSLTVPVELKKGGDAFIVNPFFDHNQGEISGRDFHVVSQGLFLGFLKRDIFEKWDLLSAFILRRNKQAEKKVSESWQYGGVILTTWKKNQFASLKFGVYYNREFFGHYFMPLVGIDWKINTNNNLFGVLPGNMVLEHRVNEKFCYGAAFRALTNSYRLQTIDPCFSGDCSGKNYLRIDDNQVGFFADEYLTKKIVVTGEAGYTILRRYRFGFRGQHIDIHTDYKNDNFYLRATVAYRFRLR